ncbi:hypothetical protein SK128_023999 [Halocaridina rubra]|uniref:Major facilitator superfamily (MFS) profile domain-containing protein n=1 Tax=Halocaridina rubra TaxID=373956 RepID=A0AAN8WKD8_HALRR
MKNKNCLGDSSIKGISISTITDEYYYMSNPGAISRQADDITSVPGTKENHAADLGFSSREHILTSEDAPPRKTTQVIGVTIVALTHLGIGTIYGFPGITLPQLTDPNGEDLYLSDSNAALFSSIVNIGAVFGGFLSGSLMMKTGLRVLMMIALPITLAFWLLLAFSQSVIVLITSRIGLGVMTATLSAPSTAYVLEVSQKDKRGLLFSIIPITRQMGFFFVYMFGITNLTWRYIAIICGIVTTAIPFIGLFFLPDSPRWLVVKGRIEEAKKSLVFYRGTYYDTASELRDIIDSVQTSGKSNSTCSQLRQLFRMPFLKTMMILSFLTILASFNGSFAVSAYLVPIFQVSASNVDAYTSAILAGAMRVVGTLFHLVFIDRLGRRPVHIYSYLAIAFTHALLGWYFFVKDEEWVNNALGWLPLANMMVYTFFVGFGQPVLVMMQGELLATNVRSVGLAFLITMIFLGGFLVTQAFYAMGQAMGIYGTFWFYSVMCFMVAAVSHFAMPETKGLSLEEISNKQNAKSRNTKSEEMIL